MCVCVCEGDIIFLLHTLVPPPSSRSSSLFLRLFNTILVFLSHLPLSSTATFFSAFTRAHKHMHTHVHALAGLFLFSSAKPPGKMDDLRLVIMRRTEGDVTRYWVRPEQGGAQQAAGERGAGSAGGGAQPRQIDKKKKR